MKRWMSWVLGVVLGFSGIVVHVSSLSATAGLTVDYIKADCGGSDAVAFHGTNPGFQLRLFDQHLGQGNGFVQSDPLIFVNIPAGASSPYNYTLDLSGWTGGPHYRVDAYDKDGNDTLHTKSASLLCGTDATSTPTASFTPTATNTKYPTHTPTATATNTSAPSLTPTLTDTPLPTQTPTEPTQTPTDTAEPSKTPTSTETPSETDTVVPSDTPTGTLVASDTPTATGTLVASETPTSTPTPSQTSMVATPTATVPTSTATDTPVSSPTTGPSDTPQASQTSTVTSTPTETATPGQTPTPTETVTQPPTTETEVPFQPPTGQASCDGAIVTNNSRSGISVIVYLNGVEKWRGDIGVFQTVGIGWNEILSVTGTATADWTDNNGRSGSIGLGTFGPCVELPSPTPSVKVNSEGSEPDTYSVPIGEISYPALNLNIPIANGSVWPDGSFHHALRVAGEVTDNDFGIHQSFAPVLANAKPGDRLTINGDKYQVAQVVIVPEKNDQVMQHLLDGWETITTCTPDGWLNNLVILLEPVPQRIRWIEIE